MTQEIKVTVELNDIHFPGDSGELSRQLDGPLNRCLLSLLKVQ